MKANEMQKQLRIGNYLLGKIGDELDERKIYWDVYQIKDAEDLMGVKDGWDEFIPLTEEWLLNLGFEKREDQKFYHSKFDRTWVSLDSILVKWYGNALGGIMMLDYVHQLQNIFFAINSEELELKEISK